MTMMSWLTSAIQKGAEAMGLPLNPSWKSHFPASGKTLSGPILFGAVARATITHIEPIICENARVAQTWSRESVCIIIVLVNAVCGDMEWTLPEEGSYRGPHLEQRLELPATTKGRCRDKGPRRRPRGCTRQGKMYPKASERYHLSGVSG